MSHQVYFVAPDGDRATQVIDEIKRLQIKVNKFSVTDERARIQWSLHPQLEEFRNAKNGAIVGTILGLLYGAATLTVIGSAATPGVIGACLILGFSALGGVMFGAIIGSTGMFARSTSSVFAQHDYQAAQGGVLVSIELPDAREGEKLALVMNGWGLSKIHYADQVAA